MIEYALSDFSYISLIVVAIVYGFLIAEKRNKVLVVGIGACILLFLQVYPALWLSQQEVAFEYIAGNLGVLGFIFAMMVLIGVIKETWIFERMALKLVQRTKGSFAGLYVCLAILTFLMTALMSNIPTILILTPVVVALIRQLKLPAFPLLFMLVAVANISGATTPISDPTTYYQATKVGLKFFEVLYHSGGTVVVLLIVILTYCRLIFSKQFALAQEQKRVGASLLHVNPEEVLGKKRDVIAGILFLVLTIVFLILKEQFGVWWRHIENATITTFFALLAMIRYRRQPQEVFQKLIDWEIIFFFMGLFILIGALEHNEIIKALAASLVEIAHGSVKTLLFLVTMGSGILSTFIDNVPYNITMVSAILEMQKAGIEVYPLWRALNLGTSIGGAGSAIGAACNVICLGQAEKEWYHISFWKYLLYGVGLVLINSLICYAILARKFF